MESRYYYIRITNDISCFNIIKLVFICVFPYLNLKIQLKQNKMWELYNIKQ